MRQSVNWRTAWTGWAAACAAVLLLAGSPVQTLAQERERDGDRDRQQLRNGYGREERRPEARRPEGEFRRDGDHNAHWWRQGDIRHFRQGGDLDAWRGGRWMHGRHAGQDGWWWVVGNDWYLYPAPVYPYPNPYVPPSVTLQGPVAAQAPTSLYYCPSVGAYYPYVASCPSGWVETAPQG